jgi:Domain of unknown function (DUF4232)
MLAPSSRHRRLIPGTTALVGIGLVLAACGGASSPSPAPSSVAASPTASPSAKPASTTGASPSAGPTPTASPSAGPTPTASAGTAIGPCPAADIVATAGRLGGAAGSRGADVAVGITGNAECRLPGQPVVALVDATGTELLRSSASTTTPGPSIGPGGTVSFSLLVGNWCDRTTKLPLHFQLVLADGAAAIGGLTMTADDLPPCNGPGQPPSLWATEWEQPQGLGTDAIFDGPAG